MKNLILSVFLILLSTPVFASTHICGLKSGSSLITYQDSLNEIHDHVSANIANGLVDLYALPDVQNLISSIHPNKVCVTAVTLSKNIYQYNDLLVVLDLQGSDGHEWITPMIFQTSSIQGHENVGPKPWVGFSRGDFTAMMQGMLKNLTFQTETTSIGPDFSPLAYASKLFPAQSSEKVDSGSLSYLYMPGLDPNWSTYLVTQLRVLDTGNLFTTQYISEVGMVQVNERISQVRWAPVSGFFDLYTKMKDLQENVSPVWNPNVDRLALLKKLSQ